MKTDKDMAARNDAAQARFGYAVAARLSEASERLDPEIADALARMRREALDRRRRPAAGMLWVAQGTQAVLGHSRREGAGWRVRLGLALALPTLLFGLYALQHYEQERFVHRIADIDTALLLDDLPPQAYTDPGFRTYLRQGA
ncbi:DUF3619 family protein [Metallibacterium scheffleri]|jgi:hypothetical protein|uniref:DUF3619 family protein n=1 Tax=Metallibacterium scheffleri TaxID=993689 RepID=UPI0026F2F85C|nr:DUF3619 family protein [Metallibacterium scheffleri]MBW8074677.1 DUF3619 family protein [Metallibacterium scheffleri]